MDFKEWLEREYTEEQIGLFNRTIRRDKCSEMLIQHYKSYCELKKLEIDVDSIERYIEGIRGG